MNKFYLTLVGIITLWANSFGQSCDHYFNGSTGGTVNSGETGCLNGNLSGTITVQPGGTLRVCGVYQITGAVSVNGTGKVILTEGTSINVTTGSWTFNNSYQLEYDGDAGCNAEIYKTLGTANVLMPVAGPLCNSSNIYLDGFWWQWGSAATRGSANIGRAPSLCGGSVGGCEAVLPVQLAYFKSEKQAGAVKLLWKTYSEIDNDRFIIEKSIDGINWRMHTELKGAGNSSTPINYEYVDYSNSTKQTYYRLTQVDFDGGKEVFDVISVKPSDPIIARKFKVYPNPSYNHFSLKFDVEVLELVTPAGNVVQTLNNVAKGTQVDVSNHAKGVYFVRVKNKGSISTTRFLKL